MSKIDKKQFFESMVIVCFFATWGFSILLCMLAADTIKNIKEIFRERGQSGDYKW